MRRCVVIQREDFSIDAIYREMRRANGASLGAVVTFVGLVRDQNWPDETPDRVANLTLEHYPGMTEASIEKILDEAEARWPLLETQVYHRVGTMTPGDQIVLVATASAHRAAAFAAAEFVMDYLKTRAVFWKKEVTANGERWVQSTTGDRQRADQWRDKG